MTVLTLYRAARWLHVRRIPFVPRVLALINRLLFNSVVPPGCEIGAGTEIAYGGIGVVIHGKARIGSKVMIGPHVLIGGNFGSGVPTIGDNVFIGPGACIIGEVTIGSNVVIGASSVVNRSLPSNCVAAGVPVRVIRSIPEGGLSALEGRLENQQAGEVVSEDYRFVVSVPSP